MSEVVVSIRGLAVSGRHGVHDAERTGGQRFVVDIDIVLRDDRATHTDDLRHTVDYAVVADAVAAIVAGEPVTLLERLCRRVADHVLRDPVVRAVTVTVAKPDVALPHSLDGVAVTLRVEHDPG